MKKIMILAIALSSIASSYAAAQQWQLQQDKLTADIRFDEQQGSVSYRLNNQAGPVLKWSPIGLTLNSYQEESSGASQNLHSQLTLQDIKITDYQDNYQLLHGKQSAIEVKAQRIYLTLRNANNVQFNVIFHLQDDGLAFQYLVPEQEVLGTSIEVTAEQSGFALVKTQDAWLQGYQEPGIFGPAYEYNFAKATAGDADEGRSTIGALLNPLFEYIGWQMLGSDGWAMPALFQIDEQYLLIAEANIDGSYPGTHLDGEPKNLTYTIEFPHPEEGLGLGEANPISKLPLTTPWRTITTGDLNTVISSTMITDLSDPLDAIFNGHPPTWVKPGAVAWDWWDATTTGDLNKQKSYVDAAAKLNWPYVMVDANWNLWNNSNPEKPIKELVAYAAKKNINIMLWYNSGGKNNRVTEQPREVLDTAQKRQDEFKKLQQWGIKGIKVDFWQTDKQYIMQQYVDLIRDAAEYELMVNLHGSTMPRGWRRTFPNMMTMEAVRGAEFYQFDPLEGPTANNNVYYAVTRNVVGAMDYTPVVFEAALEDQDISFAHSLALAVVFESALQHFADVTDDPNSGYQKLFKQFPFVQSFMADIPTAWDETQLLSGHPDSHVVFARRNNENWYIGAIQAQTKSRSEKLSLTFLGKGNYQAKIIEQDQQANTLKTSTIIVNNNDSISLTMQNNGGFVIQLIPISKEK